MPNDRECDCGYCGKCREQWKHDTDTEPRASWDKPAEEASASAALLLEGLAMTPEHKHIAGLELALAQMIGHRLNNGVTEMAAKIPARKIKENIYGNWVGYIGRDKVRDFSCEWDARYWLEHGESLYGR